MALPYPYDDDKDDSEDRARKPSRWVADRIDQYLARLEASLGRGRINSAIEAEIDAIVDFLFASEEIFLKREAWPADWDSELIKLVMEAERTAQQHLSDHTYRTYKSALRRFIRFCVSRPRPQAFFPADPALVAGYLQWLTGDGHGRNGQGVSASYLNVALAAIDKVHDLCGVTLPGRSPEIKRLMRALRRQQGVAVRYEKAPIGVGLLREMVTTCHEVPILAHRDLVAAQLAHDLDKGPAYLADLTWGQLRLDSMAPGVGDNDQSLPHHDLAYPADSQPWVALRALHSVALERHGDAVAAAPVLVNFDTGEALSPQGIGRIIRRCCDAIGLDPAPRRWDQTAMEAMHRELGASLADLRDAALLLTGWHSAMRRSNLSMVRFCDVAAAHNGDLAVFMARSKTDQTGKGHTHYLSGSTADPILNPATAVRAWVIAVAGYFGVPEDEVWKSETPLFFRLSRSGNPYGSRLADLKPLSGEGIAQIIKSRLELIGIDPAEYGGHSLRAGVITDLAEAGAAVHEIQRVSLHRSLETVMRYIRAARGSQDSPIRRLGL